MLRSTNPRRRIGLLASSSLVASTLVAGVGGAALTMFTPAVALASCAPDAAGTSALTATVPAATTEVCGVSTSDVGVYYKAVPAGNFTVAFIGETVTTNGVTITTANPTNIALGVLTDSIFNPNTGNIVASGAFLDGVLIASGGGNVEFDSGSQDPLGKPGATVTASDAGVVLLTGGGGNVTINLLNTVSSGSGAAVVAATGSGAINIDLATASGAGITVSSVKNDGVFTVSGGTVNLTSPGTIKGGTAGVGVDINAASAVVTVKTNVVSGGTGGINIAAGGIVNLTTTGDTNGGSGTGIAISSHGSTITGNIGGTVEGGTDGAHITGTLGANINMTYGANVTGASGVVQSTVDGFNTATVGTGVTINGTAFDGVNLLSTGAGAITLNQVDSTDRTAVISSGGGNGVTAVESPGATGAINVSFAGNVTSATGLGVVARIENLASTSDTTLTLGNVSAFNTGVFAENDGAGNVSITTLKNTNVSSLTNDGIDAFAMGGGNVTVSLLDGTVSANVSGFSGPFNPTGPVGSGPLFGSTGSVDPNGVHMIAVANGTVTINQNSDVSNNGPGVGILGSTVDGAIVFNINANVTNVGGNGIEADSTGLGNVTIDLFKEGTGIVGQTQNAVTVTTTVGSGILADAMSTGLPVSAIVTTTAGAPGPLNVTVTGANSGSVGVGAVTAGSFGGFTGVAKVDLSNAPTGGNISVEGAGKNVGVEAFAGTAGLGGALIATGNATVTTNAGLNVSVGTAGGNSDVGVLAETTVLAFAPPSPLQAAVTLGASNTVNVGALGSTGAVGVFANAPGITSGLSHFFGVNASVTGGDNENITALGVGAIGVEASVSGTSFITPGFEAPSTAKVQFGNGGNISGSAFGILATDTNTFAGSNVTVTLGTTAVTATAANGVGIQATAAAANSASVSTGGNVTAGGNGINVFSTTGNVTGSFNAPPNTGSAVMNSGGAVGVNAVTGGAGNATDLIGNGVGTTTINMTNSLIPTIGVLADAAGSGTASITSFGLVTVDPTNFGFEAVSGTGRALITTGVGDSYTVDDPFFTSAQHIGLYAHTGATTDTVAGPSVDIVVAGGNTINVGTTTGQFGQIGILGANTGSGIGSVLVDTTGAAGLNFNVGGLNAAGIVATTAGFNVIAAVPDGAGAADTSSSGFSNATGSGNVTVNTGAGLMTVGPSAGFPGLGALNFSQAYGIFTNTNGGNVNVNNQASITVENFFGITGVPGFGTGTVGILGTTNGKGAININDSLAGSSIQTQFGDGILAVHTGGKGASGSVTVGVSGNITTGIANATGLGSGNGVEATTNGSGTVTVNQAASSSITTLGTTTTAQSDANAGIFASNTGGVSLFGDVNVNSAGSITTTDSVGGFVALFGASKGTLTTITGGEGILAETNGNGNVTVVQAASGNIQSADDGIDAFNTSNSDGFVSVTAQGVVKGGFEGIDAITTSNDGVSVSLLTGATVTALGGNGILALSLSGVNGSGSVTVSTTGTTSVTAFGNGIDAQTNGAGVITVDNGVTSGGVGAASGGVGGTINSTNSNGIFAENDATFNSGDVFVDNEGSVTGAATNGILADVANAANGASVHVTTGSISATGNGVDAFTNGAGNVNVFVNATTNGGATQVTGINGDGILAQANGGGNVRVDTWGAVTGDPGIVATAVLSGTVLVNANKNVTGNLDGILATTVNGTDTVNVNAGVTQSLINGNGVDATTSGKGKIVVTVANGASAIGGPNGTTGNNGIFANPGGSGTILVNLNGTASTGSPAASWGVNAVGNGGQVTVNEGATGVVTDGGIRAVNLTGAGGAATVNLSGSTTNTQRQGVLVQTTTGTATVNLKGAATVVASGAGASANGVEVDTTTGPVEVLGLGAGSSITAQNNGILGNASGPGGTVTVTDNGSITTTNGNGILAEATGAGATGGVVTVTTGGVINSKSATPGTAGVLATTTGASTVNVDMTGGSITGFSGVDAISGGGNILITTVGPVSGTGAPQPIGLFSSNGGVLAQTGGAGTININAIGNVTSNGDFGVLGAEFFTAGTGAITIVTGNVSNTPTGNPVGNTDAVIGVSKGAAPITIATHGAIVETDTHQGWGVLADSGFGLGPAGPGGSVQVNTFGTVTGGFSGVGGVTDGAGNVNVDTTGGLVTASGAGAGPGFFAFGVLGDTTGSGNVVINTGAVIANGGGTGTFGIDGTSGTGNVTITNHGAVNATGDGIFALTTGNAATIQVNVQGPVTGAFGIVTELDALGTTNIVDNNAANTITGTTGDGILAFNTGAGVTPNGPVNIGAGTGARILADVSGATNGIRVLTDGTVNVFTSGNVTGGAGWGILAAESGTGGPVTIDVTGGTIKGTTAGGPNTGGGIGVTTASAADTSPINITSNATVKGTGAGSDGIFVNAAGASNVTVVSTGPLVTGGLDGMNVTSNGGNITLGTVAAPITSQLGDATTTDAAIRTSNTTGPTTINTAASATMAFDNNANYGIIAQNTGAGAGASITINNAAQIGSGPPTGVHAGGIVAGESSAGNTAGLTITNTGNIFVSGTVGLGVVGGLNFGGSSADILGVNAGLGLVQVTNSGVLDTATVGVGAYSGGNVILTNSGNTTATVFGLLGVSTGSGSVLVTNSAGFVTSGVDAVVAESVNGGAVTVASSGALTGTAGDGIDAVSAGANHGTVTVGTIGSPITSNIVAGVNGIAAVGNGIVGVVDNGSITGGTGTGIIAKSTPVPAGLANATVSVTSNGAIKDAVGIFAETTGSNAGDTVTVNVNNNVTATAGTGIQAIGVNGLTLVNLNAGHVVATADGINAASSGIGGVTVNTAAATIIDAGADGIRATTTGLSGDVVVNASGRIGFNAFIGNEGILATVNNAASTSNVTVNFGNNDIFSTNTGIEADTNGLGAVTVNATGLVDTGNTVGSSDGILAQITNAADTKNVTVNVTGGSELFVRSASGADILASSAGKGSVTVNVGNSSALFETGASGSGIIARDTGTAGSVTVNTGSFGVIGTASTRIGLDGIFASITNAANTGTVTVNNGSAIFMASGSDAGIRATTAGTGAVVVNNSGVIDPGAFGIFASGGGAVTVNTSASVTGNIGIHADTFGAASLVQVNVTGNASVTGLVTDGIDAFATAGGSTLVNTLAGGTITGVFNGIDATSVGAGVTTVDVGSPIGGVVSGTGTGSVNGGLGPVGITASSGTGGFAVGKGTSLTILANTTVVALNGRAVVTNAGNNASITNNATFRGLGDATPAFGGTSKTVSHPVVDITTVSGATTTLNNNGLITSVNAQPAADGDFAVKGTGGSVVINNDGTLLGRVNFSLLTGANNVTINNATGSGTLGLWQTTGASVLSGGNDLISNGGGIAGKTTGVWGTAYNGVATSVDFGAGTDTLVNNVGGEILVGQNVIPGAIVSDPGSSPGGAEATPAVTTFTNLETFTNNGVIVLGSSNGVIGVGTAPGGSDGMIDAVLNAPGSAFGGTGLIDLDANLWSDVQTATNCGNFALVAADCMIVGSTSGNNGIRVTDTHAHVLGAFNPTGITIVVGSSGLSTFHLDAGSSFFDGNPADAFLFGGATNVLNKPGLFFYDLAFFSSDHTERLVGIPKATAFEFASVGGAASDLWYTSTQSWFDRTTDLRDTIQGRSNGSEPGVWLKTVGDWAHRTQDVVFTLPGGGVPSFTFNTSFNRDTAGLIGGVDLLNVTDKNQAWVVGVESGYLDFDMRFTVSPDRFDFQATDFGGYATYLSGGLFVDGTINANFLRLNTNLPSLGFAPPVTSDTHGTSVGGQVEAGYNMPIGSMAFWEPVGSLSYVTTTFSGIPVPGGVQQLGNDHSFRGSLGARLGVNDDFQFYKVKLAVEARVWDEFDNDTLSTLIVPGGPNFLNTDNLKGVFGEIKGEANLFSTKSGFSAFATGGYKFKSNYSEGTVTLGARYQW